MLPPDPMVALAAARRSGAGFPGSKQHLRAANSMKPKKRPRLFTANELKKGNVEILDAQGIRLRFNRCGHLTSREGRKQLSQGYWHCPKGCNSSN